jgi:RND family efflux transporter MFP subunit
VSEHQDQSSGPTPVLPRSRKRLYLMSVAAVAVVIAIAGGGILRRHEQGASVAKWTKAAAIPTVSLISPTDDDSDPQLVLPGDVHAWYEAPLYARVSGYLKTWYFDYGAEVKKGQILADIDAPDLDAQLAAAKAKLNAASASVKVRDAEAQFAKTTFARWRDSPRGVVSVQEQQAKQADYESAVARLNAAKADVAVSQADVDRLQSLESFKHVVAPFDGVVTARTTDIGALINAGSAGSAPELFRVADTHKARIFIKVPQRMTGAIQAGLKAELHLPQYPNRVFTAKVATTSRAVNTSSRTLLVELQADNPDGLLQPGTFAEVHLALPRNPTVKLIPASALLFRQHGLEVAVVGAGDKIELKKVTLGRNLGVQVEVLQGLMPTDRIVNSPPDSLGTGDRVQIAGNPASGEKQGEHDLQADAN